MKYLFSFLLTFVILFSGVTSCSKDSNRLSVSNQLTGSWQWVQTAGGIAYQTQNPMSTGKTIELKFTGGNQYVFYTNGIISSQGTYTLKTENCIHDHTDKLVIDFSDVLYRDAMIERINNDNLELSDNAYDGMESVYIKKPGH